MKMIELLLNLNACYRVRLDQMSGQTVNIKFDDVWLSSLMHSFQWVAFCCLAVRLHFNVKYDKERERETKKRNALVAPTSSKISHCLWFNGIECSGIMKFKIFGGHNSRLQKLDQINNLK